MMLLCDASFQVSPCECTNSYRVGETVYVNLRSEKETGRARVLRLQLSRSAQPSTGCSEEQTHISSCSQELAPSICPDMEHPDRIKVEFENGDGTAHVRASRLQKVLMTDKLVVVCKTTDEYRRLARSQLTPADHVIEIGSSYGKCTEIIHQHTKGRVIGIDVSSESVAASRLEYPAIRFERFDALEVNRPLLHADSPWRTVHPIPKLLQRPTLILIARAVSGRAATACGPARLRARWRGRRRRPLQGLPGHRGRPRERRRCAHDLRRRGRRRAGPRSGQKPQPLRRPGPPRPPRAWRGRRPRQRRLARRHARPRRTRPGRPATRARTGPTQPAGPPRRPPRRRNRV
jgi:hypothetical protein